MAEYLQMAGHIGITLVAVIGLALRIEHRLTKIETDIGWLKENNGCQEKEGCKNAAEVSESN